MAKATPIAKTVCREAAAKAIPQVLLTRLEEMCEFRARALDGNDPEGVHDMRVASRRLRSALKDFKPYLRKERVPLRKLKAIADSLGAVRDEDVVLAALDEFRLQAGGKVADGIEVIAEEHRLQRRQARSVLETAIRTAMLAELLDDFRARREAASRGSQPSEEKGSMFRQIGTEVIRARLVDLSDASDAFYRPLRTKQLHRLRILTKRLRYAIELFAPCGGAKFEKIAKEIARLQTSLGELHDCDVWIANLGRRLRKTDNSADNASRDQSSQEASVWLLRHFVSERTKHYCDALTRWHEWETEGFLDRLGGMLRAGE